MTERAAPERQNGRPNYWDYLQLDRLLDLQGGLEGDEAQLLPDELHFIVVHQVFELWFKLMLREIRLARDELARPVVQEEKIPFVVHHLGRVNAILKLMVEQFQIMETLTPQDFLAFRSKLVPASGFQSFQMREMETILGLDDQERVAVTGLDSLAPIREHATSSGGGALAWRRIEEARAEETLRAVLHRWVYRTPIRGSVPGDGSDQATVQSFITDYLKAYEALTAAEATQMVSDLGEPEGAVATRTRAAVDMTRSFLFAEDVDDSERPRTQRLRAGLVFIESYRQLPLLAWPRLLLDTVVELEEQLVLWRARHARMVERTIGRRVGTGGSSGVDYLDRTTRFRIFPELWAVRTVLLPRHAVPPLPDGDDYGFAR